MDGQRTAERRQRFAELVQEATSLEDGIHKIKIEQVLDIGIRCLCQPEAAVVKDDQGRILFIPEDITCDDHERLASRWIVKRNMTLRLKIGGGKISEVFIGG